MAACVAKDLSEKITRSIGHFGLRSEPRAAVDEDADAHDALDVVDASRDLGDDRESGDGGQTRTVNGVNLPVDGG